MTDHKPTDSGGELAALALRLHTAVPAATDHAYRQLANPAHHFTRKHHLDLDGELGELLREQFTGPEQLHRFAHEPTQARTILAVALAPFVDQILNLLDQLPPELHPIVLAEAALALRLTEGRAVHGHRPSPSGRGW